MLLAGRAVRRFHEPDFRARAQLRHGVRVGLIPLGERQYALDFRAHVLERGQPGGLPFMQQRDVQAERRGEDAAALPGLASKNALTSPSAAGTASCNSSRLARSTRSCRSTKGRMPESSNPPPPEAPLARPQLP